MRSAPSLVALLLAAISLGLACLPPSSAASASSASDDTCAAASSFYCPNCGGYKVTSCLDCDGFLSTDSLDDICFARRLFQPKNEDTTDHENHYHYLWNDLAATVVWFITAGIAMACGVGGGGIYVPLGILLLQFAPKAASGLSQASIFGASLGGILLNVRNHHTNTQIRHDAAEDPSPAGELAHQRTLTKEQEASYAAQGGVYYTRPLIHYDMALFLSPMEMAGAILGVLIQKVLPNWLYLLLAALVLGLTARKTFKKYVASAAKEKMTREAAAKQAMADNNDNDNEGGSADESPTTQLEDGKDVVAKPLEETAQEKQALELELRKQYLEEDMCQFPRSKILSLVILWIGLLLLTLMKGGKGVESIVGITCESPVFAVLIVLQFLWMFGFAIVYGQLAYRNQAKRVAVQYAFLPGDPIWDMDALKTYGAFTFLAGVVAGLIGIGGGSKSRQSPDKVSSNAQPASLSSRHVLRFTHSPIHPFTHSP
jgi:uncharacterized membrane protein YfcA